MYLFLVSFNIIFPFTTMPAVWCLNIHVMRLKFCMNLTSKGTVSGQQREVLFVMECGHVLN